MSSIEEKDFVTLKQKVQSLLPLHRASDEFTGCEVDGRFASRHCGQLRCTVRRDVCGFFVDSLCASGQRTQTKSTHGCASVVFKLRQTLFLEIRRWYTRLLEFYSTRKRETKTNRYSPHSVLLKWSSAERKELIVGDNVASIGVNFMDEAIRHSRKKSFV